MDTGFSLYLKCVDMLTNQYRFFFNCETTTHKINIEQELEIKTFLICLYIANWDFLGMLGYS